MQTLDCKPKTDLGSIFDSERIDECFNNHFANVGPRRGSEIPTKGNTMDPLDILRGINSKVFLKTVKSSDILMQITGVNI